jgi:hypothetical protein
MKIIFAIAILIFAGCAASPEKLETVGRRESGRMAPPTKRFSSYALYELKPMILAPVLRDEERKVKAAGELEAVLRAKIQPLLNDWQAAPAEGRSGTLTIEPQLADLRIISGGARFWAGAFAGDSNIDMDLSITDQSSSQIAKPRISQHAGALAGGYSIGKTDQNLLDYIASTAYFYLKDNY